MIAHAAACLFWALLALLAYTYAGFPLVLWLRSTLSPRPVRCGTATPSVSLIVAAHNEADVIDRKIDNSLGLDYPRGELEVIVASDGSNDETNELVSKRSLHGVRLMALPRQGKNRALNTAVAGAKGEILVFTDADSLLNPDALKCLVAPFTDPEVGGVAGDYEYAVGHAGSVGERSYWSYDRWLKVHQSRAGSVTAASGAIFAMTRSLYTPLPTGVTDDFFMAAEVLFAGKRVVFEPRAVARGPIADSPGAEFRRKVRVMTGGLWGVWDARRLLDPLAYGFTAIQLISHKLLRRLMIFPLVLAAVTAVLAWREGWIYQLAVLGQIGFHTAALIGYRMSRTPAGRWKIVSWPFYYDLVNIAALVAVWNVIRGKRQDIWPSPRRSAA